jgi:hypothetical protein
MSRDFLLDAGERALKAFAYSLLAYLGTGALDVLHADWTGGLSVSLGATVLSVLGSIASLKLGSSGTASATNAVVTASYADAIAHGKHEAGLRAGPP